MSDRGGSSIGVLRVERCSDGVYRLGLNRPDQRNALSIELREALAASLTRLARDEGCRAVVLAGEGKAFCAGMDFTQFGGDREHKRKLLHSTRALFSALLDFPKPVVAAIRGAAVGGGFTLALCCDERLAAEGAYFGFFEVGRGIPAPYGIVRSFVDEATARDWCRTGRRIEAEEALRAGVVTEIVEAEALEALGRARALRISGRRVTPELRAALEEELGRFEAALFPPGRLDR